MPAPFPHGLFRGQPCPHRFSGFAPSRHKFSVGRSDHRAAQQRPGSSEISLNLYSLSGVQRSPGGGHVFSGERSARPPKSLPLPATPCPGRITSLECLQNLGQQVWSLVVHNHKRENSHDADRSPGARQLFKSLRALPVRSTGRAAQNVSQLSRLRVRPRQNLPVLLQRFWRALFQAIFRQCRRILQADDLNSAPPVALHQSADRRFCSAWRHLAGHQAIPLHPTARFAASF